MPLKTLDIARQDAASFEVISETLKLKESVLAMSLI